MNLCCFVVLISRVGTQGITSLQNLRPRLKSMALYNGSFKLLQTMLQTCKKRSLIQLRSSPSFDIETDEEDLIDSGDPLDSGEESDEQSGDEIGNFASFDLALGPKQIGCFAHTLQLCVKDGLAQCAILSRVLTKAAKVVNHIRKSTLTTVKVETAFGKTVIPRNETRWNSQVKMVRRLVEVNTDEVVDKPELKFTGHDKVVMKDMI